MSYFTNKQLFYFRLIAEVPETLSDTSSVDPNLNQQVIAEPIVEKAEVIPEVETVPEPASDELVEYYVASYPYQSQEPGDLSFNAGDLITVIKKEGDWWTGRIDNNVGIFPSNYVQKSDIVSDFFVSIKGAFCGVTNVFVFRPLLLMCLTSPLRKHKIVERTMRSVK